MSDRLSNKRRRFALKSLKRNDTVGIILLGDEKVGKSCLVQRWLNNQYDEKYKPTVENFHNKVTTYLGKKVNVALIDIAGSGQFPAMDELYIKRSDVVILTYEIGNEKSLKSLQWYYDNVKKYTEKNDLVIAIAGTKCDKFQEVEHDKVNDFISKNFNEPVKKPMGFETSAASNHNISELFEHVVGCVAGTMFPSFDKVKQESIDSGRNVKCCVIL